MNRFSDLTVEELKQGYWYDEAKGKYICNVCGSEFEEGEIFSLEGRYFEAYKMIKLHIQREHGFLLDELMAGDKKYTGLTDNQRELLSLISSGMSDNEISKKLGIASATVRHQRFVFRERAKQAKLYLSIYELALEGSKSRAGVKSDTKAGNEGGFTENDEILEVHQGAKMVDDRYFITRGEEEKIIESMFYSLNPPVLKNFSSREKKKIVILKKISESFERNRRYSEKELNSILKEIYEDYATIRRYLIEYGFMERTNDCKEYWLK